MFVFCLTPWTCTSLLKSWEHSEIITLSLHINWSLNQCERFYFCGRKRVRRNSYQTDVYGFLTSAHTISGKRKFLGDTGMLLHHSYSNNMSSDFHFILQKPFSVTQTFCPCCSNQNKGQYSLFLRIGKRMLCNAESWRLNKIVLFCFLLMPSSFIMSATVR